MMKEQAANVRMVTKLPFCLLPIQGNTAQMRWSYGAWMIGSDKAEGRETQQPKERRVKSDSEGKTNKPFFNGYGT